MAFFYDCTCTLQPLLALILGHFVDICEKCPFCGSTVFMGKNCNSWGLRQDKHYCGIILPAGNCVCTATMIMLASVQIFVTGMLIVYGGPETSCVANENSFVFVLCILSTFPFSLAGLDQCKQLHHTWSLYDLLYDLHEC